MLRVYTHVIYLDYITLHCIILYYSTLHYIILSCLYVTCKLSATVLVSSAYYELCPAFLAAPPSMI